MKSPSRTPRICARMLVLLCAIHIGTACSDEAAPMNDPNAYQIVYGAALDPANKRADVRIAVRQTHDLLRHIEFDAPRERYRSVHGQGEINVTANHIEWTPPADGGVLHFEFEIDHVRDNGAPDARVTNDWALFKLDHLFPMGKVRTIKGARSKALLRLTGPKGWSIETPFGPSAGSLHHVDDPNAHFDRPKGWLLAGAKLAIRRDVIADREVAVASPQGSGFRSNDVLAFVRWTLPSLVQVFPEFPPRLLIVSGPENMWRGGLSGRGSLFLHADRPLISQNGTSTPLHEMVHVASGLHATGGADWIVEGIAEYYSIEILRRSNTISQKRFDNSFATLTKWSTGTKCVATDRSEGTQTAHAVLVMRALDAEIRTATHDRKSLDDLARTLTDAHTPITNKAFRTAAIALIGGPAVALADCP